MKKTVISSLFFALFLPICVCDELALGPAPNCVSKTTSRVSTSYSSSYRKGVIFYSFISPNETGLSISTLSLFAYSQTLYSNITATLVELDNNHLTNASIISFTESISSTSQYYNWTHFKDYNLKPLQPYGIIFENRDNVPPVYDSKSQIAVRVCSPPNVTSDKNFIFLDYQTQQVLCNNLTGCNWTRDNWSSVSDLYALMVALYTSATSMDKYIYKTNS